MDASVSSLPASSLAAAVDRLERNEAALRGRLRSRFGVSATDIAALRFVERADRQGRTVLISDLSPLLGISSPACTALVDRLVRRGHIERRTVPGDRRARRLVLTGTARDELLAALGASRRRLDAVIGELSGAELLRTVELIDRVSAALAAGAPEPTDAESTRIGTAHSMYFTP